MGIIRPTITVIVLALFLGTSVLWVRSRTRSDVLVVAAPRTTHLYALASHRGGIVGVTTNLPVEIGDAGKFGIGALPLEDSDLLAETLFDPTAIVGERLGVRLASGALQIGGRSPTYSAARMPIGAVVVVTGILTLLSFRSPLLRWRWVRQGRCRDCGYDLRKSPERCPECGRSSVAMETTDSASPRAWGAAVARGAVKAGAMLTVFAALGLVANWGWSAAAPVRQPGEEVLHAHDVTEFVDEESLWNIGTPEFPTALADGHHRESTSGWACFPQESGEEVDVRAERLESTASLAYAVPTAERGTVTPVDAAMWGSRVVVMGPIEAQREYVQLLQAIRQPVGAAFMVVTAGELSPASQPSRGVQDVEAKLAVVVPEIRLDGVGLKVAIDRLRDAARVNIVVDWNDLEGSGIERDTPVKLHVWDLPISHALDLVLEAAEGDDTSLDFRVEDGVVRVSTVGRIADAETEVRIYDVRPVIVRYWVSSAELDAVFRAELASRTPTTMPDDESAWLPTRWEIIEEISTHVMDATDPDSWRDNGGSIGVIRVWAGRLIIRQTPENHKRIESLLKELYDVTAPGGIGSVTTTRPTTWPVRRRPSTGDGLFGGS